MAAVLRSPLEYSISKPSKCICLLSFIKEPNWKLVQVFYIEDDCGIVAPLYINVGFQ